jgi:cobalamin-dependent methionine synthase I
MLRLEIKPALVWKRLGMPEAPADASFRGDFDDAYGRACATLEPRFTTRRRFVSRVGADGVVFEGGVRFASADLCRLLEGADAAVFFAATVGDQLDGLIEEFYGQADVFKMTVADAVGSVAAEGLIARVHADVRAEARANAEVVSRRLSPGFGDFALTDQPQVLEMAGGADVGIHLTENCMMVPRKSVTAVVAVKGK